MSAGWHDVRTAVEEFRCFPTSSGGLALTVWLSYFCGLIPLFSAEEFIASLMIFLSLKEDRNSVYLVRDKRLGVNCVEGLVSFSTVQANH